MDKIRYYAKENFLGETTYFTTYLGSNRRITGGHLSKAEALNNPIHMLLTDYPKSKLTFCN